MRKKTLLMLGGAVGAALYFVLYTPTSQVPHSPAHTAPVVHGLTKIEIEKIIDERVERRVRALATQAGAEAGASAANARMAAFESRFNALYSVVYKQPRELLLEGGPVVLTAVPEKTPTAHLPTKTPPPPMAKKVAQKQKVAQRPPPKRVPAQPQFQPQQSTHFFGWR